MQLTAKILTAVLVTLPLAGQAPDVYAIRGARA